MSSSQNYYDHNRDRYAERSRARHDLDALREFAGRLATGAKVLDAGCGPGRDLRHFNRLGFDAEGLDSSPAMVDLARRQSGCKVWRADLRLLTLPREHYDGIWAHRSLNHLNGDECRRALASFFAAARPDGILFVSIDEGEGVLEDRTDDPEGPPRFIHRYRSDDFGSLIRQHGFALLASGRNASDPMQIAFIARRIR